MTEQTAPKVPAERAGADEKRAAMKEGEAFAKAMMPSIHHLCETSPSPLLWWGGFLSYIAGAMVCSVGKDASIVLRETIAKMAEGVANDQIN